MEKKVDLKKEERLILIQLNKELGLNLPKKESKTLKGAKKILLKAWKQKDRTLHDLGISRLKIQSLSARISGFNHFVFRRPSSVWAVLSDV